MGSPRRIGSDTSKSRQLLLEATERVMLEHGYAAVSSRRIAEEAGLKHQLVHYYFRSMDDLFVALLRWRAEQGLERQTEALRSEQPLRALWEISIDPRGTALSGEFVALANHREPVRSEMAAYAHQFRATQEESMRRVLEDYGIDPEDCPAVVVLVLMNALSRVLIMEDRLGLNLGHEETSRVIERLLNEFEGPKGQPKPRKPLSTSASGESS